MVGVWWLVLSIAECGGCNQRPQRSGVGEGGVGLVPVCVGSQAEDRWCWLRAYE